MGMRKIKKNDIVVVLTGKDKGRNGKVLAILPTHRARVEGLNLVKKHVKPNPHRNETGGILEREASIHLSNLALYNPFTKKADRVGFKILQDGQKVRYFKSNGEVVDTKK